MPKVRKWEPDFRYYEELVGIECTHQSGVDSLIEALWTRSLRTCPHEIIANTVIVPKDAVCFLSLDGVKHKKIELVQAMSIDDRVKRELDRRFASRHNRKPHYYTTGKGVHRTCCRYLVPVTVVRKIKAGG